tara:strand:+ start:10758 stop:10877 length:120 start_codon:yes stop_codon:yes gene_type:complete
MITKMLYIAISFIVGFLIGIGLLKMFVELSKEKDNGTNN